MAHYDFTRIPDPIHGPISLSELEARVVDTKLFQRLRRVSQLGLVPHAFPSANYSRFVHSIGSCHVIGRMLDRLRARSGTRVIKEKDYRRYRLAALLHDIGHYPLSHVGEHALRHAYRAGSESEVPSERANQAPARGSIVLSEQVAQTPPKHEEVGRLILLHDPEIKGILDKEYRNSIAQIVGEDRRLPLDVLLDSDMDADKIDYLARTSHATGLPYGQVDFEYLLRAMHYDPTTKRIFLDSSGLRSAEHLSFCRFFDYVRVAYNPTAVGMALLFEDTVAYGVANGHVSCTEADVESMVADGNWFEFDDHVLHRVVESVSHDSNAGIAAEEARSLLHRRPPAVVYEREMLLPRQNAAARGVVSLGWQALTRVTSDLAEQFDLEQGRLRCCIYPLDLTKMGARLSISEPKEQGEESYRGMYRRLVKIWDADQVEAKPLIQSIGSVLHMLSQQMLVILRLYVLPPEKWRGSGYRPKRERLVGDLRKAVLKNVEIPAWADAEVHVPKPE